MGKIDLSGLKLINAAPQVLRDGLLAACREYANRGFRGQPIVYSHFTAGNQGRYGWAPLSPDYAAWKAGVTKAKKSGMRAANRTVPKGKGLPMLVLTGELRDAITSGRARIFNTGPETLKIVWQNDPIYARIHHNGEGKMPKRSPVDPNPADIKAFIDAANRYISGALGSGGTVAAGGAPGGRARIA